MTQQQTPLSDKARQDVEAARAKAQSVAGQLRASANDLQSTSNFQDEILLHREYPGKLRYSLRRGARRLELGADALDSFISACGVALAGGTPKAFKEPAFGPDVDGWTKRTGPQRHSLLPDQADALLGKVKQQTDSAAGTRKELKAILGLLRGVEATKQTAHLDESVRHADGLVHAFAEWLETHQRHARKMVDALKAWDRDGFASNLPGVGSRKPRRPTVKGPDGKKPGGGSGGAVKPGKWPGDNASKQDRACWLARSAAAKGLPPTLPVVAALVESDLTNIKGGDAASTGLFQIQATMHPAPAGFGSASGKIQGEAWWNAHPEAQMAWFAATAGKEKPSGTADTKQEIAEWAARIEKPAAKYRGRYADRYAEAKKLVDKCSGSGGGGGAGANPGKKSSLNANALDKALAQLKAGIKEVGGEDRGPKVAEYLKEAGVSGPAPWCAAFVKWCFEKAGFNWPPGNWAYCPNYLNEAKKDNGIFFPVSHSNARPGDLIVWHGHIGIVKSEAGGTITYVAGNQGDKVTQATISTGNSGYQILRPRAQ